MTKIAFLTSNEGIEKVELVDPWKAVVDAGLERVLLAPEAGEATLFEHLDHAGEQSVDATVAGASVDDYAALVLPGGVANPDALRGDTDAVTFVRDFVASGKPVAAICHAPWMLVEADVVGERTLTSFPSLRTDVVNAGGTWVDESVVTDANLITSRNPGDLPGFISALLESVQHGAAGTD